MADILLTHMMEQIWSTQDSPCQTLAVVKFVRTFQDVPHTRRVVYDSARILDFLDSEFPATPLLPAAPELI